MADNKPETDAGASVPAAKQGGIGAWLPLIVTVVTMPAMAYAMTSFVLLPKMKAELASVTSSSTTTGHAAPAASPEHGQPAAATSHGGSGHEKSTGKEPAGHAPTSASGKKTVPLDKVLVNVAGSMGSRYLMASMSLASSTPDFESKIKDHQPQLIDLAAGILSSKTVADLEKPGARNIIRSELLTVFNNALGAGTVQEIYLTEFAVQ
jgi:flagellar FliL protein